MSEIIITAAGTRYDLANADDRYFAIEMAISVIQDYRIALLEILTREKARPTPRPARIRDLEHAYAEARQLRRGLHDNAAKLTMVLRDILPLVNILQAALDPPPSPTSAELAA